MEAAAGWIAVPLNSACDGDPSTAESVASCATDAFVCASSPATDANSDDAGARCDDGIDVGFPTPRASAPGDAESAALWVAAG
jgi:hypothetical protein